MTAMTDPAELRGQLDRIWSADTSASPHTWTPDNPCAGHCAVVALAVQDRFGGTLLRGVVPGDSHYWNLLPDGREIDLTRDQFPEFTVTDVSARPRDYLTGNPATNARYQLLTQRLAALSA